MSTITATAAQFPTELVTEMFNKVKGHSSLAALSGQTPIPFSGTTQMVFNLDGDVSIVGEGAAKPAGSGTVTPVVIRPLKFVYQMRVSDEFIHCADEKRLQYLQAFADGFSRKIGRGFDIAAMHGVNPATSTAISSLATNNFDGVITSGNTVTNTADANAALDLSEAIGKVVENGITGMALAPTYAAAIGTLAGANGFLYPEFAFGGRPSSFAGHAVDVNGTLAAASSTDLAIVGDFENAFKWGYAMNVPLEVIEYGDPDGAGRDLKQYNEVCLRAEAYIGWGILDAASFAKVVSST